MDKEKCNEAVATKWALADTTAGGSYKLPAGRKGTFDRAKPVKSAFALLSTKVTKPVPIGTKNMTDKKGGIAFGENDKRFDGKRFSQS